MGIVNGLSDPAGQMRCPVFVDHLRRDGWIDERLDQEDGNEPLVGLRVVVADTCTLACFETGQSQSLQVLQSRAQGAPLNLGFGAEYGGQCVLDRPVGIARDYQIVPICSLHYRNME